jgi:TolB-like protein
MPFVNLSEDKSQEFFSDGLTDDLITDLSKISGLFVTARHSAFAYKGKPVTIRQVAEELGVRYILEGSVRREGDQVRINAQLIDSASDRHVWAERYDGSMKDVFSLQDKINERIVTALAAQLTAGEKTLITKKGTHDPAAYEEFLRGRQHYLRSTKADYAKAEACFKKAIELDPNYNQARAALALLYNDVAVQGPSTWRALRINYEQARLQARQYLQEAMKEPSSVAYLLSGYMELYLRQWDEAITQYEKALALDPNDPSCFRGLGWALISSGRPREAIEHLKKAMKLDPQNPAPYLARIGLAHFCRGEWQEAATASEKAMKINPDMTIPPAVLASAYAHLGLIVEAKAAYGAFYQRVGAASPRYFWPFKDRGSDDSFFEGLIEAGASSGKLPSIHVSEKDQLTGDELRAFYFPSTTTGYFSQGADWTLEIGEDGTAILTTSGLPGGMDRGRSWLEANKLWLHFPNYNYGIAYCSTTFRNPAGTPEAKNEYISFNDVWFSKFSRKQ